MAELRKYGKEARVYFPLIDFGDSDYEAGVTIEAGDATISKDGGSFVNVVGESDDDFFAAVGNGLYSLKVAAAELQCKTAVIRIVDQTSPKEWEDQMVLIDTYGHANAQRTLDLGDIISVVESHLGEHTAQGNIYYVSPNDGATHASGARGGRGDPYNSVQECHDNAITNYNHDLIILLADASANKTEMTFNDTIFLTKNYFFIRGPGRDFIWTRTGSGDTISVTGDGVELSGFQLETDTVGNGHGIQTTDADFVLIHNLWINETRGDGINVLKGNNLHIHDNIFTGTGIGGAGAAVDIKGTGGTANNVRICGNHFRGVQGDAISISGGVTLDTLIQENIIEGCTGWAINIGASSVDALVIDNRMGNNASGPINDGGTTTVQINNEQWATDTFIASEHFTTDALISSSHSTTDALISGSQFSPII